MRPTSTKKVKQPIHLLMFTQGNTSNRWDRQSGKQLCLAMRFRCSSRGSACLGGSGSHAARDPMQLRPCLYIYIYMLPPFIYAIHIRALPTKTLPMESISPRLYHKKLYYPIQIFYHGVYLIFLSDLLPPLYQIRGHITHVGSHTGSARASFCV
jgi:hypothetical protein